MSDVNYDLWHPSSRHVPERNEMDDLIDWANDLAAEVARLTAELAAIKARTCETCARWRVEYGMGWCYRPDGDCGEQCWQEAPRSGFCHRWQGKEDTDASMACDDRAR